MVDPIVIAAVITSSGTLINGFLIFRASRRVNALHREIKTNSGKQASDYLEMVETVRDVQDRVHKVLLSEQKARAGERAEVAQEAREARTEIMDKLSEADEHHKMLP